MKCKDCTKSNDRKGYDNPRYRILKAWCPFSKKYRSLEADCNILLSIPVKEKFSMVELVTHCIICNEEVGAVGFHAGPVVCNKCRAAVLKMRELMEDMND